VNVLKGADRTYRRSAIEEIGFDTRLLGSGPQAHRELSLRLRLRRGGRKLISVQAIEMDHFEWRAL